MSASDLFRVQKFFERGLFFFNKKEFPDACTNFKDALQINPNYLPARINYALALAEQHKYVDAIKVLEEGRKLVPLRNDQQVEVLRILGNICLIRQDYRAATYYLKAARKIDPQDSKLRMLMATCLCKSGDLANGIDLLLENAKANA
ncbi:MAG: tetratricopeptide repeat protein [Proteobacteria bacterium]|jgi:predicted Zn-dependent protease|nr:tetratricopeptide repeat protein [Pseudomonadota bacterium]MBQ4360757.1 tetratricopeptide repeat protein [Pseudomonadota bacterium]